MSAFSQAGRLVVGTLLAGAVLGDARAATFFEETFEDGNLAARGWYDNTALVLSSAEHIQGSGHSAEFHFPRGAAQPATGGAIRRRFPESDSVYLAYWVKYSAGYTGSNQPYHPHEFLFMTNKNGAWDGPAFTHLTAYVEQNEGVPLLAIQDARNIDQSRINQDLTGVTENRAVAGCNGTAADGYSSLSCYDAGGAHCNGKIWSAGRNCFQDAPGPFYKNDWHRIEAYFRMNTIRDGKGAADGVIRYWYDGTLLIEHTNVVLRTGANPDMRFNQFLIAPWIGDGSPVDQTMWVDDLIVADARPGGTGDEPSYFRYDAEDRPDGAWVPQPPFFPQPWQDPDTPHPARGRIAADGTAPQGTRVMRWDVTEARSRDLYTEIRFSKTPPAEPRTFYYAFFVRFDRLDGRDIWHPGGPESESFDKAFEVIGDGIRWTVNFGERGMNNRPGRFSLFLSNPTYHLNPDLEVWDSFYQNHGGRSRSNSIQLEYEQWHAVVFAMKWAADKSGEVALWADGEKVLEYKNIATARAPGTFERLQIWGTIAQPAYDAPPHTRKVDALLFTDAWQDVLDGGYLRGKSGPVISSVSGPVRTGGILTITGARLNDEAKADWDGFFRRHAEAWSFEGANPAADGYSAVGPTAGVYDTEVFILGSKSMRFDARGRSWDLLHQTSAFNAFAFDGYTDFYARAYVRWNLAGGRWPDGHCKMLLSSYYLQPAMTGDGTVPTRMAGAYTRDGAGFWAAIPSGPLENGRWYAVEAHFAPTTGRYEAWLDGVKLFDRDDMESSGGSEYLQFGVINACCTAEDFHLEHWWDGLALASSRIYPSAMVAVGDGPDFAAATRVAQELRKIDDAQLEIKLDLAGLGAGPYYLWVTNNRRERSAPYLLGATPSAAFLRGDANANGGIDIADAVFILRGLFADGTRPACLDAADANDDGAIDIADAVATLGYLFAQAGPLPAPFGACGIDPTPDELDCLSHPPCEE